MAPHLKSQDLELITYHRGKLRVTLDFVVLAWVSTLSYQRYFCAECRNNHQAKQRSRNEHMRRPAPEALLIGVVSATCFICIESGMILGGLYVLPDASQSMAAFIFWPILIPIFLSGAVLGLCLSHRSYRHAPSDRE